MKNSLSVFPRVLSSSVFVVLALSTLFFISTALCQDAGSTKTANSEENRGGGVLNHMYGFLKIPNADKRAEFKPMTQNERNQMFMQRLSSPVWLVKASASAGFHQWADDPEEWEQGASGYGKRYADVLGQYAVRNTVRFGLESLLHEDNRYFGSGKKGAGRRIGYALSSGFLARHDNGKRYPSVSLIVSCASGAGLSRLWQPPSTDSYRDAASRFAVTMGWNVGLGVLKEFMPDLLRPFTKKH